MKTSELRNKLEQRKGKKDYLCKQLDNLKVDLNQAKKQLTIAEKSQLIVQFVAKQTQNTLEYHIGSLASLAIQSIMRLPYELKLNYEEKNGKTECDIVFFLDGKEINPMFGDGLGLANIAALALRPSLLKLMSNIMKPAPNKILFLDENLVNLKGTSTHERACEFIKMLCDEMDMQIIYIPSQIEEISLKHADKIFEFTKQNKISKVEEIDY